MTQRQRLIARMAGNIAAGLVCRQALDGNGRDAPAYSGPSWGEDVARHAARIAESIIKEVEAIEDEPA